MVRTAVTTMESASADQECTQIKVKSRGINTQFYNSTLVYNHKRHGVFKLGNRQFDFRVKPRFPKKLTSEFLFVDLLNNLEELAEDRDAVLSQARNKLMSFNQPRLQEALNSYGNMATRKRVREWIGG